MKHVHADAMLAYAQDAMETDRPWERWEVQLCGEVEWIAVVCNPSWNPGNQYRRKPCAIKVNGFDVPEPMREAPEKKIWYWAPDNSSPSFASQLFWADDTTDNLLLQRGQVHLTKEAAAKHAMAMCGIDPATYKEEE